MNKIVLLLFLLYAIGSISQENYDTLRIPIVFHVIDHSIKDGDIPDQEFEKLVQLLNRNFSEPNSTYISPIYFSKARNTKIKFYIPSKTKNCESIDPITWTHTNEKYYKFNDDFPLIDVHQPRLENKNFLNVYLVRIGSEKGSLNGYYKSSTSLGEEGIVLDWTLLYRPQENLYGQPNSVNQGVKALNPMAFALSHEIGHFFNLKHTWGAKAILFNGCNHQTQYIFGDFVDDTPPQPGPNEAYKKDRFNPTNKLWSPLPNCSTSTPSNYQNFMDYGYGAPNGFGMFTEGQVIRMRDYIDNKKQSLVWKPNCKEFSESVLSQTKQREKFGTRMIVNNLYPFGTITDRDMVELFNSIGLIPTKEKLEELGLKIVDNNKFKVKSTGEFVDQHQIYERLDLEKTKAIANKTKPKDELEQTFIFTNFVNIINPNYYSRKVILINNSNNKEIIIDVGKAGINIGDKKSIWTEVPLGKYTCRVYTTSTKKEINSFNITVDDKTQTISLQKNGYN